VRVSVLLAPEAGPRPRDTAVVVDVLRATTTLTVAFEHGAARVIPAAGAEEAFALRQRHPEALLCGERDGRMIAGFDRGNSPFEYPPEVVAGRTLVFASTNGALALLRAAGARRRLLAAFINAPAVVEALRGAGAVTIVCSGKLGGFALEDAACAGWLCARLGERGARLEGAAARLARRLAPRDAAEVRTVVQGSSHGRMLREMGGEFARDVDYCAGLGTLARVPEV